MSTPGVGATQISTLARAASTSSAICAPSSSGLIAIAMPAASPPQIAKCVSGRFGSTNAATSPAPMPALASTFAVLTMSARSSAKVHVCERSSRPASRKKVRAGASGVFAARSSKTCSVLAGSARACSGTRSICSMSWMSRTAMHELLSDCESRLSDAGLGRAGTARRRPARAAPGRGGAGATKV
ncbi:hypothetical protein DP42_5512 [Burkholderia pseudomallei]|nr:hypothetical protein DP42_5512 [Burkholderia pseudomallei]